jgi:type IV pilus assembly protein PilM
MAERVLGLDVGTTAVRVVEVALDHGGRGRHGSGGRPTVTRVGEVPLPPGAVRDGEVVDPASVGAAITELWRQTGLRSRDVRVGLTGSRVVVRVVDMPAMPDDELEGAVRFSAADHIPIPLEEAVLDHAILEPAPPGEPGAPPMVKVLIAATHRSALDGLLAAVAAGGLRAVAVDLVPFALVRALTVGEAAPPDLAPDGPPEEDGSFRPPLSGPGAEAIVSVGAALTTVVVHEGGRPRFVRTVQAGGDMLTAAIADELGLEPVAAEDAKRAAAGMAGPAPDDFVVEGSGDDLARRAARVVELRLSGILGEIQSGLAYWMAQADRPLSRIVLTGGGARAGDIAGRLTLLLGTPVEWGVVEGLEAPERAAGVGEWPDLAVAAGLALGSTAGGWQIDFCPPIKRSFRFTGEMARRLAVAAAVIVLLLGGLSVRSVLSLQDERGKLAAQKKTNAKLEADLAQYSSLKKLSADLDASRRRVQSALAGDVSWTRFIDQFVRSMPAGAWIGSLSAQTNPAGGPGAKAGATAPAGGVAPPAGIGSVQVSVSGLDYPTVAAWLRQLGADPDLTNVNIGSVTSSPSDVSFSSTATITPAAHSDRAANLTKAAP